MTMNWTTLTGDKDTEGSIKYFINYSRIDSAGILEEAEAWIYSKLRTRDMIASDDVAISDAASSASFPTGYLDCLQFGIPGYMPRLRLKDIEWFRTHLGWDESATMPEGVPTYWADFGGTIQLNTSADQAYTAKMVFYKRPTALSASNETNFLTTRYPTLLRRACLMFAAEARKEWDTHDRNEIKAMAAITEVMVEDDTAKRGIELDFGWESN